MIVASEVLADRLCIPEGADSLTSLHVEHVADYASSELGFHLPLGIFGFSIVFGSFRVAATPPYFRGVIMGRVKKVPVSMLHASITS
jgi:hypothetical protein